MNEHEYPVYEYFVEYMGERGPYEMRDLEWLADLTKDEAVFSSYILASTGGWDDGEASRELIESLLADIEDVTNVPNIIEVAEKFLADALANIDAQNCGCRSEWIHGHRSGTIGRIFNHNWVDLAAHTIREWSKFLSSMGASSPSDWIDSVIIQEDDPFYSAFNDLQKIDQFGRLTKFDCLEIANRAGNVADLYPSPNQARRDYIYGDDPRDGFMIVFCSQEASISSATKARKLTWRQAKKQLGLDISGIHELLRDAARDIVDRTHHPPESVVYDMESCLCTFSKNDDFRTYLS